MTTDPRSAATLLPAALTLSASAPDPAAARPTPPAAASVTAAATGAVPAVPVAAPIVLPFVRLADKILLRATVNGQPAWLALDTGTSLTSLDAEWAGSLDRRLLPQRFEASGGGSAAVSAQLAVVRSVRLGEVELRDHTVALLPFATVRRVLGHPIHGTLGFDFLSRYVVEVDYDAQRLTLHDPASYRYAGAGHVLPVSLQYRIPMVRATLVARGRAPVPARLFLDTGASGLVLRLNTPFVAAHDLAAAPAIDAPLGVGVAGPVAGRVTRLQEARLGGLVIHAPTAGLARDTAGFFASTFVDGNIGADVFSRTRLILDYARERVIVGPGPTFGEPYEFDMSGLVLTAEGADGRTLRVTQVLPDSPAAAAGVRAGDEVLSLDGRPGAELSPLVVSRAMRTAGARRHLTVRRGADRLALELTLRRLI